MKCKCNNCDFIGNEEDLSLFETKGDGTETITAEETADHKIIRSEPIPENPFYFKGCPNCKTDGYLMDIDEAAPVTSSGNKHTTGEWQVTNSNHADYLDIDGDVRICSINISEEILNEQEISREEAEANAKLIAAAPDLLKALQNMVNISYDTARPTQAEKNFNLDQAIAAIKKATEQHPEPVEIKTAEISPNGIYEIFKEEKETYYTYVKADNPEEAKAIAEQLEPQGWRNCQDLTVDIIDIQPAQPEYLKGKYVNLDGGEAKRYEDIATV